MKTAHVVSLLCLTGCLAAWPGSAKDKADKTPAATRTKVDAAVTPVTHARTQPAAGAQSAPSRQERWVDVQVTMSDDERRVVRDYVRHCKTDHSGPKAQRLPPGLAKKAQRGRELPPGWQKKCLVGEIMPVDVYARCEPLPVDLAVRLPPPPHGTITVTVGGKIVRLIQATREILDVFDVHTRW